MRDDEVPKHRSSKNTKKWCKGKVGVQHVGEPVTYAEWKHCPPESFGRRVGWWVLICKNCRKELDWYYPIKWMKREQKVPAWVPKKGGGR